MRKLVWKQHVEIENNPYLKYNIDDTTHKRRKRAKIALPKGFSPDSGDLSSWSKSDRKRIETYVVGKLDFPLLLAMLKRSSNHRFLSKSFLERFIGKALLSAYQPFTDLKRVFEEGVRVHKDLAVSDEYFLDMIRRRKKNIEQFHGLLLITLLRGQVDTIEKERLDWLLHNLSPDIDLGSCFVLDGDMTYSYWNKKKEVHELSPTEMLKECNVRDKVLETFFEKETLLTVLARVKSDPNNIFSLLTSTPYNVKILEKDNLELFKISARMGLTKEVSGFLDTLNKTQVMASRNLRRGGNGGIGVKKVLKYVVGYGATENHFDLIFKVLEDKSEKEWKSIVDTAVKMLLDRGLHPCCTCRFRLLNGIFNLFLVKKKLEISDEDVSMALEVDEAMNNTKMGYNFSAFSLLCEKKKRSGMTVTLLSSISKSLSHSHLHKWLVLSLENNDFDAEKMSLIVLEMGLKPFISRFDGKNGKERSDSTASSWGGIGSSSVSESSMSLGVGNGEETDREEEEEDERMLNSAMNSAGEGRKRRRSTLGALADFFVNVKAKFKKKTKISSKDKVKMLENAAEYGSRTLLNALLLVIVPDLNGNLLKCCYLSTISEKSQTQVLLVTAIHEEIMKIKTELMSSISSSSSSDSAALTAMGERGIVATEAFVSAYEEYKRQVEAMSDLREKENNLKLKVRKEKSSKGQEKEGKVRQSLRRMSTFMKNVMDKAKKKTRRKKKKTLKTRKKKKKGDSLLQLMKENEKENIKKKKEKKTLKGQKKKKNPFQKMHQVSTNVSSNSGSMTPQDAVKLLLKTFENFLLSLLGAAIKHGAFQCSENILSISRKDNNVDEKLLENLLVARLCALITQRRDTFHKHVAQVMLFLNKDGILTESVIKKVFEEATKKDFGDIQYLRTFISKLNEKSLTMDIFCFVVEKSAVQNKSWDLWPRVIKLIYKKSAKVIDVEYIEENYLTETSKPKVDLSPEVKKQLENLVVGNLDFDASQEKGRRKGRRTSRRRSSLGMLFNKARNSFGSFSKSKRSKKNYT